MITEEFERALDNLLTNKTEKKLQKFFDADTLKDTDKIEYVLEKCVERYDVSTIHYLLELGVTVDSPNEFRATAIHASVYTIALVNCEIIDLLFLFYGTKLNYVNERGLSHLHVACMAGNAAVVEDFLNGGADVDARWHKDEVGREVTPLHLAVEFCRPEIVELLLRRGANPNPVSSFGVSPLHFACGYFDNALETTNFIRAESHQDKENSELEMVKILVGHGAEVNARNLNDDTPLNNVFNIELLNRMLWYSYGIESKPKSIKLFRDGQRSKIEFLLGSGADVTHSNKNGDTILHLAIKDMKLSRYEYTDVLQFDDENIAEMIERFLKSGADVDAKNNSGETPLQLAVALLSLKTVKVLLEHNADTRYIKFDCLYDCFMYIEDHNIFPFFSVAYNLIMIIEELVNSGFQLNQRKNLDILKFFVRIDSKIQCQDSSVTALEAILSLLKVMDCDLIHDIDCGGIESDVDDARNKARSIYSWLLYTNPVNRNILRIFRPYYNKKESMYETRLGYSQEIEDMKNMKLTRGPSLYDILRIPPRHCYSRIKTHDYRTLPNWRDKFCLTWESIEQHFTMCLIRRYIVESARDCLATLIDWSLPYLCSDLIFEHLNNESLLNLCSATVDFATPEKCRKPSSI